LKESEPVVIVEPRHSKVEKIGSGRDLDLRDVWWRIARPPPLLELGRSQCRRLKLGGVRDDNNEGVEMSVLSQVSVRQRMSSLLEEMSSETRGILLRTDLAFWQARVNDGEVDMGVNKAAKENGSGATEGFLHLEGPGLGFISPERRSRRDKKNLRLGYLVFIEERAEGMWTKA